VSRHRWLPLVLLTLVGGVGGFAAAAASLTVEGLKFTPLTFATVAAAIVTSAITAISSAQASKKQDALLENLNNQLAEDERLAIEFHDQIEVARADRSKTAGSLALLAAALGVLLTAPLEDRERLLGQFQIQLVRLLGETLEGPKGIFLSPIRVVFLERTEEPNVLLRRGLISWGYGMNASWEVAASGDDGKVAKDIMYHFAPFKPGYLVADVRRESKNGTPLFLESPEEDVESYCRVGVSTNQIAWGILCVDSWKKGVPISKSDMAIISAFGDVLGVALAAVRTDLKEQG
jgi:hypothetical protein